MRSWTSHTIWQYVFPSPIMNLLNFIDSYLVYPYVHKSVFKLRYVHTWYIRTQPNPLSDSFSRSISKSGHQLTVSRSKWQHNNSEMDVWTPDIWTILQLSCKKELAVASSEESSCNVCQLLRTLSLSAWIFVTAHAEFVDVITFHRWME